MSFWQRITATLRADAHGVIDALEDRALLLKQHLRDAEAEVQGKQAHSQALAAERQRLERDLLREQRECAQHERDAELALEAGQEALARYALQHWLSKQQLSRRIQERLGVIAEESAAQNALLAQQEPALNELRARVAAYLSEHAASASQGAGCPLAPQPVAAELVELELLRRRRERGQTEPGAAS
jgi:phage shock protein A